MGEEWDGPHSARPRAPVGAKGVQLL